MLVFATLIYLAKEVRQNTANIDAARYETIMTGFNDIGCTLASDAELAHLFNLGINFPKSLNQTQQALVAFVFCLYLTQYEKVCQLHRTRVIDREEWITFAKQCGRYLGPNGGRMFLERNIDYPVLVDSITPEMSGASVFEFSFTGVAPPNKSVEPDT
ncbi:MAG: hypothetical protein AAF387_16760 [Pseudomonadota bacterium]